MAGACSWYRTYSGHLSTRVLFSPNAQGAIMNYTVCKNQMKDNSKATVFFPENCHGLRWWVNIFWENMQTLEREIWCWSLLGVQGRCTCSCHSSFLSLSYPASKEFACKAYIIHHWRTPVHYILCVVHNNLLVLWTQIVGIVMWVSTNLGYCTLCCRKTYYLLSKVYLQAADDKCLLCKINKPKGTCF